VIAPARQVIVAAGALGVALVIVTALVIAVRGRGPRAGAAVAGRAPEADR
jgi:hypothetical protein